MNSLKEWLLCFALLYRVVLGLGCRRKALALELSVDPDKRALYKRTMRRARDLESHPINRGLTNDVRNRCMGFVEGSFEAWDDDMSVLISSSEFSLRMATDLPQISVKINPLRYC